MAFQTKNSKLAQYEQATDVELKYSNYVFLPSYRQSIETTFNRIMWLNTLHNVANGEYQTIVIFKMNEGTLGIIWTFMFHIVRLGRLFFSLRQK